MATATSFQLQQLYIGFFGRPADPAGLSYWLNTAKVSQEEFSAQMSIQPEYTISIQGLSINQQIDAMYVKLFGRNAEAAGLAYWTNLFTANPSLITSLPLILINAAAAGSVVGSPTYNVTSVLDNAAITNKATTAGLYTADVLETSASQIAYNPTSATPWVTGPQFTSAVAFLATATAANTPSAAAVQASVDAMTAITSPGQTFTLTTGTDLYVGTSGNDIFNGNNITFTALDNINGAAGNNTLNLVDSGTANWTLPSALVSNVQTINLRNVSGTGAIAAVKETATITFQALTNSQSLTLSGLTFTAGSAGATATQVASAFAGGVAIASNAGGSVGSVLAGTLTTYGTAAGMAVNQVVFTQSAVGSPITDLAPTGTSTANAPQVSVLALTTNPGNADNQLTITVNNTSITTVIAGAANAAGLVTLTNDLAAKINGVLGRTAAVSNGIATITLTSAVPVAIGGFAASGTSNTTTFTNSLAPRNQKLTFATDPGGTTAATFLFDGISYTTATLAANSVAAYRNAVLTKLNSIIPGIATGSSTTIDDDAIIIDNGLTGFTFLKTNTSTLTTVTSTTSSLGVVAASLPSISVVQGVSAAASTGLTDTLNAGNFIGSTSFVSDKSTGAVVINDLTTQTVSAVSTAAAFTANYKSSATTTTLNIVNGNLSGAVTITGTGLTSATVNSTDASNKITSLDLPTSVTTLAINAAANLTTGAITAAGLTTVTVGGAATSVIVSTIPASVTNFNASGLTAGGVTATLSATANSTVTGGGGTDTITTAATTATGQLVNAGGGTTDVLVLAATNDVSTSAIAAQYLNFEVLRLAKPTQGDLSIFGTGIAALQLEILTSGNFSGISATQASSITVRGNQTTALTLTLSTSTGTSDVVALDLKNSSTTASNVDIAGLSIIGVETLNIKGSTQSATITEFSDIAFASGGADQLTAIKITGVANVAVNGNNLSKAIVLDASTSAGAFGASGSFTVASNITGSITAINTLTVGASADTGSTYIGGNNNDLFFSTAALLVANGTGDTVLNGGGGSDTLTLTGTADVTVTDNNFTFVTNFENLTLESTGVVSLTTGAGFNTAFTTGAVITNANQAAGKAYTLAAGLANTAITFTLTTANVGSGTSDDINIATGSGNDSVTINASAWVGAAGAGADLIVATGAGSDTINVSTSTTLLTSNSASLAPSINGGAGQDFITTTHVNGSSAGAAVAFFKYVITAGESTTTASDNITGFNKATTATGSDQLDFTNAALNAYSTTSSTGVVGLNLAVAANGLVTFSGTNSGSASLADRVSALQNVVTGAQGDSAVFGYAGNTYVFNNDTAGDSLVTLIGVTGVTSLITTAANTNHAIFIS